MSRREQRARTVVARLLSRAALLAMAGTALTTTWLPLTSPAWAAAPLVITSDAGGSALVNATNLGPGPLDPRCILISYTDAVADDGLWLFVATSGSTLADFIDVTIDVGQGGRYGDCSGFTGSTVYEGTLGDLGRDHGTATAALPMTALAAGAGEVSFRFGFAIRHDNRAQGSSAGTDLIWTAGAMNTPGEDPPGDGTSADKPKVITPLTGVPSPSATSPSKQPRDVPDPAAARANKTKAQSALAGAWEAIGKFIREASEPLAKGVALGLAFIPLGAAFVLIQGFIDRREPKLAQAPAFAEPDLPFGSSPLAVGR